MEPKPDAEIETEKVSKNESQKEDPGRDGCEKPVNCRPGPGQGDTRIFDIITNIGVSFLVSKKPSEILGAKYRKRREQRETIS